MNSPASFSFEFFISHPIAPRMIAFYSPLARRPPLNDPAFPTRLCPALSFLAKLAPPFPPFTCPFFALSSTSSSSAAPFFPDKGTGLFPRWSREGFFLLGPGGVLNSATAKSHLSSPPPDATFHGACIPLTTAYGQPAHSLPQIRPRFLLPPPKVPSSRGPVFGASL